MWAAGTNNGFSRYRSVGIKRIVIRQQDGVADKDSKVYIPVINPRYLRLSSEVEHLVQKEKGKITNDPMGSWWLDPQCCNMGSQDVPHGWCGRILPSVNFDDAQSSVTNHYLSATHRPQQTLFEPRNTSYY